MKWNHQQKPPLFIFHVQMHMIALWSKWLHKILQIIQHYNPIIHITWSVLTPLYFRLYLQFIDNVFLFVEEVISHVFPTVHSITKLRCFVPFNILEFICVFLYYVTLKLQVLLKQFRTSNCGRYNWTIYSILKGVFINNGKAASQLLLTNPNNSILTKHCALPRNYSVKFQ